MAAIPFWRRHWTSCALACAVATGCSMTQETVHQDGSFITGGSGGYGQSNPDASSRFTHKVFSGAKGDKPSQKLQLAYGQFQERQGDIGEARKSYEQVLAQDAKSVDAIIGLARLDQVAGRTTEAEQGFQKAIRLDSRSGRALDALGQFYLEQQRWNEAAPTLAKAMQIDPSDKTYRFHYAVALAKSGQVEQSWPYLVDSVGLAAAHYNTGLILHERGNLAGAEEHFVAAILQNPRMEQAQRWLDEIRRDQQGKPQLTAGKAPSPANAISPVAHSVSRSPSAPPPSAPVGQNARQWEQWKNQK